MSTAILDDKPVHKQEAVVRMQPLLNAAFQATTHHKRVTVSTLAEILRIWVESVTYKPSSETLLANI